MKDARTFEAEKRKAAEQAARDRLAGAVKQLALVDVHLLDHFVIRDGEVVSFAECG